MCIVFVIESIVKLPVAVGLEVTDSDFAVVWDTSGIKLVIEHL